MGTNPRAKETLHKAAQASRWDQRTPPGHYGRGIAVYERGTASGKSSAVITLDLEGNVVVFTGVPDVGPGIHTVIQQIVAETLGTSVNRVQVKVEDTDTVPYDTGVGGSRATNTAGHAAYKVACEVRDKLVALVARRLGCQESELQQRHGVFLGPRGKRVAFGNASRLLLEENGGSFSHLLLRERSH